MNTRRRGGSTIQFHPRCGETVLIRRRLEYRGLELVVILQPDNSFACIPAWMTHGAAGSVHPQGKALFLRRYPAVPARRDRCAPRLSPVRIKDGGDQS